MGARQCPSNLQFLADDERLAFPVNAQSHDPAGRSALQRFQCAITSRSSSNGVRTSSRISSGGIPHGPAIEVLRLLIEARKDLGEESLSLVSQ